MKNLLKKEEEKTELDIIVNNEKHDTYGSTTRIEESYTNENEELLKKWYDDARISSVAHNKKGRAYKYKHEIFGLPASLIPIMYSPIAGLYSEKNGVDVATAFVLVTTGVLNGVYTFFNFGTKMQRHFEYEAKYADLSTTILVELSKERELRIPADRFIEMVQSKIDNFGANAPLL